MKYNKYKHELVLYEGFVFHSSISKDEYQAIGISEVREIIMKEASLQGILDFPNEFISLLKNKSSVDSVRYKLIIALKNEGLYLNDLEHVTLNLIDAGFNENRIQEILQREINRISPIEIPVKVFSSLSYNVPPEWIIKNEGVKSNSLVICIYKLEHDEEGASKRLVVVKFVSDCMNE
ncbi:MAG: hypothetical protein GF411_02645 [Candidatus Lokiarchaeota archaeon]|nr:hypothetical protein [Candidatus Lokiarchaeota archaeon]